MTLEYYSTPNEVGGPGSIDGNAAYVVEAQSGGGSSNVPPINYKFNEDRYISEIWDYINKTYGQHYSQDKFQATEFIFDGGHGTGFNIGNVLKYAQRYGKKGTKADHRKDLMKVIHYAILQLHVHDEEVKKNTTV